MLLIQIPQVTHCFPAVSFSAVREMPVSFIWWVYVQHIAITVQKCSCTSPVLAQSVQSERHAMHIICTSIC